MESIVTTNNVTNFHKYKEGELLQLHEVLYELLGEIHRICAKHGIPYFLIGGSAIGLYYDKAILPWDDDLDIGMTREDYNRFLSIASQELSPEYFLSYIDTDFHTPFFYAKVKKNGTLFVEGRYKNLEMHHGIFVDIFPFDKIPQNKVLRSLHYKTANFLKCCFMGKEIWLWNSFGKCQIDKPLPRSAFSCFINKLLNITLSKKAMYKLNVAVQTLFNRTKSTMYSNAVTKTDTVLKSELDSITTGCFGPIEIYTLKNVEPFLLRNFPTLHRYTDEEVEKLQCNHAPSVLSFNE